MKFKTKAQKVCYNAILSWIKESYGEIAMTNSEIPVFAVFFRTLVVYVMINPWNYDEAQVMTKVYVLTNQELKTDLMNCFLRENDAAVYFEVDLDNKITGERGIIEHNIVGSINDVEKLSSTVRSLLKFAAQTDEIGTK